MTAWTRTKSQRWEPPLACWPSVTGCIPAAGTCTSRMDRTRNLDPTPHGKRPEGLAGRQVGLGHDPERLCGDGQGWVHRGRGGEEAAVHDPQIADVMAVAQRVEHAGRSIGATSQRPALVAVHADVERL